MRWAGDLFQTWRAGLTLLLVLTLLYGVSFLVAATAIYALQSLGAIDPTPAGWLYWGSALLVLPYFLASAANTIRDCAKEMQLPPSPPTRQLDKAKASADK